MLPRELGRLIALGVVGLLGILVVAQQPSTSQWPGINIADDRPNGCVDCHKVSGGKDLRLSTTLKNWATQGTSKEAVNIARAVFPRATVLTGRHPDVSDVITGGALPIPGQCLACHKSQGRELAWVIHLIHLSQSPDYVKPGSTLAERSGNNCTSCHAFSPATGAMIVKGGSERR